uniref:Uncharacterized protein n=1 Tax=Mycena chlorophos TaxID=658473 RepID=A0ABQ0MAA6_MYCCL|nr:predicted protein [Mycena chlorophos]
MYAFLAWTLGHEFAHLAQAAFANQPTPEKLHGLRMRNRQHVDNGQLVDNVGFDASGKKVASGEAGWEWERRNGGEMCLCFVGPDYMQGEITGLAVEIKVNQWRYIEFASPLLARLASAEWSGLASALAQCPMQAPFKMQGRARAAKRCPEPIPSDDADNNISPSPSTNVPPKELWSGAWVNQEEQEQAEADVDVDTDADAARCLPQIFEELEKLPDENILSSAQRDLMITGPALCLYFAALRCVTSPPSVPLPRSNKTAAPMELSYENCPPAFVSFLRVWSHTVAPIQTLPSELQHDLARIICGLQAIVAPLQPALNGIAAGLRAVAIEISQRRLACDRVHSGDALRVDCGFARAPSVSAGAPPHGSHTRILFAILDVATTAVTPEGNVVGVLGKELTLGQCPPPLRPFMCELAAIGQAARTLEEEDNATAMKCAQRGKPIPPTRMDRVRMMLELGVGSSRPPGASVEEEGRRSVEGRAVSFTNRINALSLGMTRLKAFRERQQDVFTVLAGIGT